VRILILASILATSAVFAQTPEICSHYQQNGLSPLLNPAPVLNTSRGSSVTLDNAENTGAISLSASSIAMTITGHVEKYEDVVVIMSATERVTQPRLVDANNVEVRFWRTATPGAFVSTRTDEQGNYAIELSNGEWQGEACGSGIGYSPSAWQVSLSNNQLMSLQEATLPAATLTAPVQITSQLSYPPSSNGAMAHSIKKNEELVINGSGFGCNGSLVFEFHNSVGTFGKVRAVEYNHEPIVKGDYCSRTDQQIRLPMPSLRDANVNTADSSRYAKVYYKKGNQRSNAIYVSEFLTQPLNPALEDAANQLNNDNSIINMDVGQGTGDFGGSVIVGGPTVDGFSGNPILGGSVTPFSGVENSGGSAVSGSAVGAFGAARILDTQNIGGGLLSTQGLSFGNVHLNASAFK